MNPYLEVLTAAAIWGSAGVFIKLINLPASTVVSLRLGIASIVIAVYLITQRKSLARPNSLMISASILNGIRSYLYFLAYSLTSIGNAVIILYTWPFFASFFGSVYLKERLGFKKIILLFLAFVGIVIMFSGKEITFENKDFIGMNVMLVSSAIYGLIVPIFKKGLTSHTRTETIFYQNIAGAILFLPFLFINKPFPTFTQVSTAAAYSLLIGIVAYIFFFNALRKIPTATASLLSYFEVISALAFGVILFKEQITLNMITGGILIITTSILITRFDRKKEVVLE